MKFYSITLITIITGGTLLGQTQDQNNLEKKAKEIHERVITIDTHDDIRPENFTASHNYTTNLSTQVNLPKMRQGGLDVAWFIVYTGQGELNAAGYEAAYKNAISKFEAIHRLTEEIAPNEIGLATTSTMVKELVSQGKLVAMIGVENGYSIGMDICNIEKFYELGARYMSLAHNGHSQLSDSNTGEADNIWLHHGLSDFGKEAVIEMNRLGMMIDISHPSKEAALQMFKLSKAPIIASHSAARALSNHSRNLDDETLLLFKKYGGVVQAVAFSSYVNVNKHNLHYANKKKIFEKYASQENFTILESDSIQKLNETERSTYHQRLEEIAEKASKDPGNTGLVNVQDFVDHIDYLVDLIGIDHVGISSDFDGGGGIVGWRNASETFNVTLELVKRGYTEEEIAKIWGGNLLRVLDEVQEVSRKIKNGEL